MVPRCHEPTDVPVELTLGSFACHEDYPREGEAPAEPRIR